MLWILSLFLQFFMVYRSDNRNSDFIDVKLNFKLNISRVGLSKLSLFGTARNPRGLQCFRNLLESCYESVFN